MNTHRFAVKLYTADNSSIDLDDAIVVGSAPQKGGACRRRRRQPAAVVGAAAAVGGAPQQGKAPTPPPSSAVRHTRARSQGVSGHAPEIYPEPLPPNYH